MHPSDVFRAERVSGIVLPTMKSRSLVLSGAFLFTSLLGACGGGTTPTGEGTGGGEAAYVGPITSTDVEGGQALFATKCGGCHTGQSGSYGPAIRDLGRTPEAVRQVIREGRGRMPGFTAEQISADDLEKVMAFLQSIGTVPASN